MTDSDETGWVSESKLGPPPAPGLLRPHGPRDPGDAWVEGPNGERFWGRFGAAGLLVVDAERGILLQHRVEWSHFGGTWGLPGGARHEGEDAVDGAIREAGEEAGVRADALRLVFDHVFDLDYWTYTTVVASTVRRFDPVIGDRESLALRWVPADEVDDLPLHPGFAASWPGLRDSLFSGLTLVVDAANVIGSRPDGWWKDRAGATGRLLGQLGVLVAEGVPADGVDLPHTRWWPDVVAVVEGQARVVDDPEDTESARGYVSGTVGVVRAEHDGDQTIVDEVAARVGGGSGGGDRIVVVTSDRELRDRVSALGASVRGAGWLLDLLEERGSRG